MTERLYYTDARLVQFDAEVVDRSADGRRVYLDRSAFYPTSGGQPHDTGTLNGVAVTDVIDEDTRVAHVLAEPLAQSQVHGKVDWVRRWDLMQQHTGQHLLSAVFADQFGYETVSVHFGPDYATLDLAVEQVTADKLHTAATIANTIVTENRPVRVTFEDAASAHGLRKPSDRDGLLRIVTITDCDRSACGGTHVGATGEIGPILLRRQEKMKKTSRIEFLSGQRAVHRAAADYAVLQRLATGLSASIDELPTLIPAQVEQLKASEQARRKLEEEVAGMRAKAAWDAAVPDAAGVRWMVERRSRGRPDDARTMALAFAALPAAAYVARFAESNGVFLAASADSGIDAGKRLKEALSAAGGRGGGSPRVAQGTTADAIALDAVWSALGIPAPS